jgi:MazG family protein
MASANSNASSTNNIVSIREDYTGEKTPLDSPAKRRPVDCAQQYLKHSDPRPPRTASWIRFVLETSTSCRQVSIRRKDVQDFISDTVIGNRILGILPAQIATEAGEFRMADVIAGINTKIRRRHPHVFGEVQVSGVEQVLQNWEQIKTEECKQDGEPEKGLLDGVPRALPALEQAVSYQKRAARVGFDWPNIRGVRAKLDEEIRELDEARSEDERADELGDLFFAAVNYARWLQVDPEAALRMANAKFRDRFGKMEAAARARGRLLKDMTFEELDALWEEAKRG